MYIKTSLEEVKERLKNCLTPERYEHSRGVMEKAVELAKRFNCNVEKAEIAGLLHDCAKCLSKEELHKYKDCFNECEINSSKTWHAPVGAIVAKEQYGIEDTEILSAIRWHTIGKKDMTDFEKIIYLADKIEEKTREDELKIPITQALNERDSLDDAMFKSFEITLQSLLDRKLPICFQTIDVYNCLLDIVKE